LKSSSSDDEEHVVSICFMEIASGNEVLSSDDESDLFYDELMLHLNHFMMNLKS
jgi:hypothetical protein